MSAPDPIFSEAIDRLQQWLEQAQSLGLREPQAGTLSTADRDGSVTSRIVLIRQVGPEGLIFFTNSMSTKGQQLESLHRAAICYYWDSCGKQIRVEGAVTRTSSSQNDRYWESRPRESQIASVVSQQSKRLENRQDLETAVNDLQRELEGHPVPRPPHWIGYQLIPDRIEFFTSLPARLHERICFYQTNDGWKQKLLYP